MKQKTGKYLIITSEEFSDSIYGPCVLYVANPYTFDDSSPFKMEMAEFQEYSESDYFIYPENSSLIVSIDNLAQSNKPWKPNLAEFEEGRMNYGGRGFIKVYRHFSLLKKSSKLNDTSVDESSSTNLCNMGDMYFDQHNYLQAVKYYSQAVELGNANAMWKLGYCYLFGNGVEKNNATALKYIRRAADLGNAEAMCCLGQCHCEGMLGWSTGIREDFAEAVKWFKKAAAHGHPKAMYLLGSAYKFGHGVSVDYEEAAYWFTESAELGDRDAMYSLANCFRKGDGVDTDITEAAYWYEKAAELGNRDAMYNIAICYYKGHGVSKDKEKSREWFEKAYRCGDLKALKMLREYF